MSKNPYFEQTLQQKVERWKWTNMLLHIYTKEYVASITVHPQKSQAQVSIFKDLIQGEIFKDLYFSLILFMDTFPWVYLIVFRNILRQIINNGFQSNKESWRTNLFFTLTQTN